MLYCGLAIILDNWVGSRAHRNSFAFHSYIQADKLKRSYIFSIHIC